MITSEDFQIVQCQTAVFTPGLQFRPQKVLDDLLDRWPENFGDEPLLLPQRSDAPEIPRLVLKSGDGKASEDQYRLQAGSARMDLFWNARSLSAGLDLDAHLQWSVAVIKRYLELTKGSAGRLAVVIKRVAIDKEPAKTLSRHFCKQRWHDGPLNRPSGFELHAHKIFALPTGFRINSWFRCRTAVPGGILSDPAVSVEQDFNTLAEETEIQEYAPAEIEAFFGPPLVEELARVLDLYFPKVQQ